MTASIPHWVPVVFLGLVFLGYRQSLPRVVKPGWLVAIALAMFCFSFIGVLNAFGPQPQPLALLAWASGYALALVFGARHLGSSGLSAAGAAVRVPGSWAPLALMLGIFAAKFVLGFTAGVHSPLLHQAGFVAVMSFVLGGLSGGFGARAVAVHRYASGALAA